MKIDKTDEQSAESYCLAGKPNDVDFRNKEHIEAKPNAK